MQITTDSGSRGKGSGGTPHNPLCGRITRLAPRDGHRSEHANGEFRQSGFLRDVNQGRNLGDGSSLVTGTSQQPGVRMAPRKGWKPWYIGSYLGPSSSLTGRPKWLFARRCTARTFSTPARPQDLCSELVSAIRALAPPSSSFARRFLRFARRTACASPAGGSVLLPFALRTRTVHRWRRHRHGETLDKSAVLATQTTPEDHGVSHR